MFCNSKFAIFLLWGRKPPLYFKSIPIIQNSWREVGRGTFFINRVIVFCYLFETCNSLWTISGLSYYSKQWTWSSVWTISRFSCFLFMFFVAANIWPSLTDLSLVTGEFFPEGIYKFVSVSASVCACERLENIAKTVRFWSRENLVDLWIHACPYVRTNFWEIRASDFYDFSHEALPP